MIVALLIVGAEIGAMFAYITWQYRDTFALWRRLTGGDDR